MGDTLSAARRILAAEINSRVLTRAEAEELYGRVWDTQDLCRDYDVLGFAAPLVVVRHKSDGVVGTLVFQHHPRLYWGFEEDRP